MKDNQNKQVVSWLVRIDLTASVLFGLAAVALVTINYEWLIIIEFLVGIVIFVVVFAISAILWRYTFGYVLAFGIGILIAYKERNDE